MKRWQLMEVHDQAWCPCSLRDGLTRFLTFSIFLLRSYRPAADLLAAALRQTGDTTVVDLCAGSGGPWRLLLPRVRSRLAERETESLSVALSDKYPNTAIRDLPRGLRYIAESVDALSVSTNHGGFRTLFTSFHHFEPEQAEAILADAVRKQSGIAVFEFTRRHPLVLLPYLFVPGYVWLTMPFRRSHWRDWLWTYPIPILPMVVLVDGVVSCLRTYSPQQCLELAAAADPECQFRWDAGVKWSFPGGMTYLIGTPRPGAVGSVPDTRTSRS